MYVSSKTDDTLLSTTVDYIEGTAAAAAEVWSNPCVDPLLIWLHPVAHDLLVELSMKALGDVETVNQIVHRIRNLVAVICEFLQNKNPRLTFSEAYEGRTYTEEKWKLHAFSTLVTLLCYIAS
jgi:hypothetical protein